MALDKATPLDTPVRELTGVSLVVDGVDLDGEPRLLAVRILRARGTDVTVQVAPAQPLPRPVTTPGEMPEPTDDPHKRGRLPGDTPLRVAVMAVAEVDAHRAAPAAVSWPILTSVRLLLLGGLAMVLYVVMGTLHADAFAAVGGGLVPAATIFLVLLGLRSGWTNRPVPVRHGGRRLKPAELRTLLAGIPEGPTPAERVDVVTGEYGRLLSDIVYRIENSALFDAAVPASQRFQLALVTWDADAPDAAALAAEVEDAFAAARTHAEQLGFEYLPRTARESARRAVKAATLALTSGDTPERAAAARSAADLLAGVRLYYLPVVDPATPTLIAARPELLP